jgi:hypothetical protein
MTLSRGRQAPRSKMERLAKASQVTGAGRLVRAVGAWNGVMAFAYHRIGPLDPTYDSGFRDATPEQFDEQLRFLKQGFDVIGLDDIEAAVRRGRGRYVLLTFDDGYRDNIEQALPILVRHRLPATLFVTSGFLDRREIAWWDEVAWMVQAARRTSVFVEGWLDGRLSLAPTDRQRTTRALIDRFKQLPRRSGEAFLDALAEACGSGRHARAAPPGMWMTWDDVRALRAGRDGDRRPHSEPSAARPAFARGAGGRDRRMPAAPRGGARRAHARLQLPLWRPRLLRRAHAALPRRARRRVRL